METIIMLEVTTMARLLITKKKTKTKTRKSKQKRCPTCGKFRK